MNIDPWRWCDGELDLQSLPAWVDRSIIETIQQELAVLGPWLSLGRIRSVTFALSNSTATHFTCYRTESSRWLCPVPVGLIVRLDYLCRLLETYGSHQSIHMVDGFFHGFEDPEIAEKHAARPLPVIIRNIVDKDLRGKDFWTKMITVDSQFPTVDDKEVRAKLVDRVKYALLYFCMHEAAHVFRMHDELIPLASTTAQGRRGAEVDADVTAGRYLSLYCQELDLDWRRRPFTDDDISEKCWTYSYGVCLVLGSFDIERYPLANFSSDDYLHPTARLMITLSESLYGWSAIIGRDVAKDCCYEPSARGSNAYIHRMDAYWIDCGVSQFHRPTALYFPFIPWAPEELALSPFKEAAQTVPSLYTMYREAVLCRNAFEEIFEQHIGYGDRAKSNAGHYFFR
ncbi:hypothetical protein [Paraburkholderia phenoliruptrix]|uniref:hypothetical protein n=1 Tax=Paraburkholderia phenoliruptrix TaxID=252970 RepID=UPI002869C07E|nr:hypothetical protein [Paraburkholderia phenoliruptrix]WMY11058.1 hypothetical protein P3F88_30835 [Paraburkholderia phenoliruptrix]